MPISLCMILVIPLFVFVIMGYINKAKNAKVFVAALDTQDTVTQSKSAFIKTKTGYYQGRKFSFIDYGKQVFMSVDTKLISEHKDLPFMTGPFMFGKWKKLGNNCSYYGGKVYYTPFLGLAMTMFYTTQNTAKFHTIFNNMIAAAESYEAGKI